jgi:hypothetical protein
MLYQDTLGRLYEVPEPQVYGLGYAGYPSPGYGLGYAGYDGIFDTIAKSVGGLVSKALPAVASFIPGGSLISQALPALAQGMTGGSAPPPPVAQPIAPLTSQLPAPIPPGMFPPGGVMPAPGMPPGMMPGSPYGPGGMPMQHRPWPHGWIRPQIPYTGLGPQRLYLRCSTWPGQSGLVPAMAAQAPLPATQAAASAAAQTATALMRRRPPMRRHRR